MTKVEVGDEEEKVALATRARLQETFTKDVVETTRCQVLGIQLLDNPHFLFQPRIIIFLPKKGKMLKAAATN